MRVAILATAFAAAISLAPLAPASAAPPATADDHVSMYAGGMRQVNVLKNDSDPDGDELAVCRIAGPTETADYSIGTDGQKVFVFLSPDATGDISITYYACDFETLVPATLTVSVKEIIPPTVAKTSKPGRLRVTNDNDQRIRFLWGDFDQRRPDGHVGVSPHDSVVVRVHRHVIDWVAVLGHSTLAGQGHVRGIELPSGDSSARVAPQAEGWPPGIGA